MDFSRQVSLFIDSVLQEQGISEVNRFFERVIGKYRVNLANSPELYDLYSKLSIFTDKLKILKLLFTLKNYLIIESIPGIDFRNLNSQVHKIRVKVKKIGEGNGACFLAELRNQEIFGLTESGDVVQSPDVKLKIKNQNGLIYINTESEALVEFISQELQPGYEFCFSQLNKTKAPLIIRVNDINESEVVLYSFENGLERFNKISNDLKTVYSGIQSNVRLVEKNNSWFFISKKPLAPYLVLKPYYAQPWFFITSGFTIIFNKIQFSIKYSYIN